MNKGFDIPKVMIEWKHSKFGWQSRSDNKHFSEDMVLEGLKGLQETPERFYYYPNWHGLIRISYAEPEGTMVAEVRLPINKTLW